VQFEYKSEAMNYIVHEKIEAANLNKTWKKWRKKPISS